MSAGPAPLRLSVVVPSWRDAESLMILVPRLVELNRLSEIIVVDASADAATEALALQFGITLVKCSAPNRGAQMNVGAMFASGDIVIFHHADSELEAAHLDSLQAAMRNPEVIGGAFYRKFDGRHPRLMFLEKIARHLTRRGGTLYGDQSIFVRREKFLQLQGFAKIPLMEDMEFSKRLRAAGRIVILDPPIRSSARRHLRKGAWRTSIQNGIMILLYKGGVSPIRLHRWYYRDAVKNAPVLPVAPPDSLGIAPGAASLE